MILRGYLLEVAEVDPDPVHIDVESLLVIGLTDHHILIAERLKIKCADGLVIDVLQLYDRRDVQLRVDL